MLSITPSSFFFFSFFAVAAAILSSSSIFIHIVFDVVDDDTTQKPKWTTLVRFEGRSRHNWAPEQIYLKYLRSLSFTWHITTSIICISHSYRSHCYSEAQSSCQCTTDSSTNPFYRKVHPRTAHPCIHRSQETTPMNAHTIRIATIHFFIYTSTTQLTVHPIHRRLVCV